MASTSQHTRVICDFIQLIGKSQQRTRQNLCSSSNSACVCVCVHALVEEYDCVYAYSIPTTNHVHNQHARGWKWASERAPWISWVRLSERMLACTKWIFWLRMHTNAHQYYESSGYGHPSFSIHSCSVVWVAIIKAVTIERTFRIICEQNVVSNILSHTAAHVTNYDWLSFIRDFYALFIDCVRVSMTFVRLLANSLRNPPIMTDLTIVDFCIGSPPKVTWFEHCFFCCSIHVTIIFSREYKVIV